ncbi:OsmC family protein [Cellulomonas sp. APG4]|uniref:OsmC family protein n=1 Tax=Cellulomonas sp. APG4 TaxID=1538656 RepID=UPI001379D4CF|nr:OsmC family protein [Cellulomonas sp. APG4]NCT91145.1 OsmC family protein [Cellulomonas sp. APG4]
MSTPTSSELRDLQRPLKERYREDPEAARIPARAVARVSTDGISADVDGWAGTTTAGLHPAAGGDGSLACSADLLLDAVAACAGVTLRSVAIAMGVELRAATVEVEGHWDARGTLAVDRSVPVGLTDVEITFHLETDADQATQDKLVQLAERYCVVAQTLASPPRLSVRRQAPDATD